MATFELAQSSFIDASIAAFLLFLTTVSFLVWRKIQVKMDPQEPPLVKPKIPFIGHIIGLITQRLEYWHKLGQDNSHLPIFTVSLGPSKLYIIASPQLIQLAMRKKTLSFEPLTVQFAERMVGFGPELMNLMRNPPTDGSENFLSSQHRAYDQLAPGPALYDMNTLVLNSIAQTLNAIGSKFETKTIYLWLRDSFTLATTAALFGVKNPVTEDPKLINSLWDYETGQIELLTRPLPWLTAPKAYRGRTALQHALRAYFKAGHDQNSDVSSVIKSRAAINKKWGLPGTDIADHELGMLFVSITNAIPTLFWMVMYVFRDPKLVSDLQNELLEVLEERKNDKGERECIFNISRFSAHCPLLVATYNEVMRLTNRQLGTRTILEDTYLDYRPVGEDVGPARTYLLKKGVNIQMPSSITNFASATWGEDVYAFEPKRFLTPNKEKERQQKKAFNPFGGGKHLCPGRHFAYAEILGAVAALVVRYEILTLGGGRVKVPKMNNNLAEAVGKPVKEDQQGLKAKIRKRPGWEDVRWGFVSGSGTE